MLQYLPSPARFRMIDVFALTHPPCTCGCNALSEAFSTGPMVFVLGGLSFRILWLSDALGHGRTRRIQFLFPGLERRDNMEGHGIV